MLTSEVSAGFQLLGARAYADLLGRTLAVGGDLPELNRKVTDQSAKWDVAKEAGNGVAIQAARQGWRAAFDQKREREDALHQELAMLSDEYKTLLESKDHQIEPFIEAYFDAHPDEFVC